MIYLQFIEVADAVEDEFPELVVKWNESGMPSEDPRQVREKCLKRLPL